MGACCLLLQGTDLLTTLCKAVDPRSLARVACTCRTLRTVASAEEVWMHHCPPAWRDCGVRPRADGPQAGGGAGAGGSGTNSGNGAAAGAREPGAWIDAYTSWASLAIAAATAPSVGAECSESEVCSLAASLVAQRRIAHADFVLCLWCVRTLSLREYHPCVGVWLDMFVLIGHVLRDKPRMRHVLTRAAHHLCVPWAGLGKGMRFFDALCGHCDSAECNNAQCQTLAVAMLLSMASRFASGSAGAAAGAAKNGRKGLCGHAHAQRGPLTPEEVRRACKEEVYEQALRHNQFARLECRRRAAWLLSQKVPSAAATTATAPRAEASNGTHAPGPWTSGQAPLHEPQNLPPATLPDEPASPSYSSSSGGEEEGDDDFEEAAMKEQLEAGVSRVAAACARVRELRKCAKEVAVVWMCCASDIALFQSPLSRCLDLMRPAESQPIPRIQNLSAYELECGLCLRSALFNLSDVLLLVGRDAQAVASYFHAEFVARALGKMSLAVYPSLRAADAASELCLLPRQSAQAPSPSAARFWRQSAMDSSRRALMHAFDSVPLLFAAVPAEEGGGGGDMKYCGHTALDVVGAGLEAGVFRYLFRNVRARLQRILSSGVAGAELVGQLRGLDDVGNWGGEGYGGWEESHYFDTEKVTGMLQQLLEALLIRKRLLQIDGLFGGDAASGTSTLAQAQPGDVQGDGRVAEQGLAGRCAGAEALEQRQPETEERRRETEAEEGGGEGGGGGGRKGGPGGGGGGGEGGGGVLANLRV